MDYYLISISKRANQFFVDDQFNKTIIKKYKDKVRLSVNIILNKFLKKTIVLNMISFTKTREIIVRKNSATNYDYYYSAINITINISKLV